MCWIQTHGTGASKPCIGYSTNCVCTRWGGNRGTADKATSHLLQRCHVTNVLTIDLVPLDCPHVHGILINISYAPTLPERKRG